MNFDPAKFAEHVNDAKRIELCFGWEMHLPRILGFQIDEIHGAGAGGGGPDGADFRAACPAFGPQRSAPRPLLEFFRGAGAVRP